MKDFDYQKWDRDNVLSTKAQVWIAGTAVVIGIVTTAIVLTLLLLGRA